MLRLRRVVSWIDSKRELQRATGCPWFQEFQNKNPREIALIGLKHINLKRLLMPFVSSLEKTNGYGF
jgi:hypothetical protein